MKLRKILDWSLCPRAGSVLRPGFVKFCSVVFVLPCWQTKQQRDAVGGEKKTPSGANIKTSRRQFIMDLLTAATSESESENCSDVPQINHTFPHLICRLFRDLMWRPDVRQVARLRWTNLPEIQVASKTRWVQFKAKSRLNTSRNKRLSDLIKSCHF